MDWERVMAKAATWLFYTYLALKMIHLVFRARRQFDEPSRTLLQHLRSGEPALFAAAFLLSVPVAVWSSWYFNRGYERVLVHSIDCYGRLAAAEALPTVRRRFGPFKLYDNALGAEGAAGDAADWLNVPRSSTNIRLQASLSIYRKRYALLARQGSAIGMARETDAIERCVGANYSI